MRRIWPLHWHTFIALPPILTHMKKEMSSFDVRSMANEMAALEGGHMDKVFHYGRRTAA